MKRQSKKPCLLVTGVGGRSVGCQILYALSLLGKKYRVIAVDADAFSYGLYQVDAHYIVPLAHDPEYLPAILRIVREEKVDAILPGTEPELNVFAANRELFEREKCLVVVNPPEVVKLCANKWNLYGWLESRGFSTPKTRRSAEWRDLVKEFNFPIIGKPAVNTGGSKGVAILKDDKDVRRYFAGNRGHEDDFIFQEYLPAEDQEYTVGVLISKEGDLIDSIVLHRHLKGISMGPRKMVDNRFCVLSTGYSQGFIVKHPVIQKCCEELALKLGSRGPLNIQGRFINGRFSVFEVHPRFSGTTSIRAEVGFNEVDTLLRNFLWGEKFGKIPYKTDVAAIRAFCHSIVPLKILNGSPKV
jgi:carbamoyl-phosphate synthase large subunit